MRLARILEDGHDDAERRCRQDDGDEQRIDDHVGEAERDRDGEPEDHGCAEAQQAERQRPAPQGVEVELQAGEEEQERDSELGQHLDRPVRVHPAERRRADGDPGEDLDDRSGQRQPGEQAEGERDRDGEDHDDQEAVEGHVGSGFGDHGALTIRRR